METLCILLDSYFTYLELISSLLVRSSSHLIILELITILKILKNYVHIIGYQLFYMVLVSILQLFMFLIQMSRFIFFPRRVFLRTSTFSLEQQQHQQFNIFFVFLFMSFLEGGFFPCGFASFLISLDKTNYKRVTIALLLGPICIYISD